MPEIYFSVDVEADGPYPGQGIGYSMSSLGAVACAVMDNKGIVTNLDINDEQNQFYCELQPISEKVDERAAAVSGLNRQDLIDNGENPIYAMKRLNAFVRAVADENRASPVFVAWPTPYDWFWTYWYLMRFAGESAFGFSGAVNMKDVWAVKAGVPFKKVGKRAAYSTLGVTALPHTHNALDDAIEQAQLWQAILAFGGGE